MEDGLYAKRGVSASKSEVHEAIKDLDQGLYPRAFCKILPDVLGSDPDYANVMHADTAGTKGSLAYLYWKQTGDLSVWKGIAQDALVMNLDDMACVGACQDIVISSTIGRNKHQIPGSVIAALIEGTQEFLAEMQDLEVRIHHSGGETADVGDIVRTVDVGFTAFARLPRKELFVNDIQPGMSIVGFSSSGQASYESFYNGGMGSNGLTSARHDLLKHTYAEAYPESFDPQTDRSVVYCGPWDLEDPVEGVDRNVGQLILSPTRTYLPLIYRMLEKHREGLGGLIHCTGGAQSKVLGFVDPIRIVKSNPVPVPPLFSLIREASQASWQEMYQVFNMGWRLESYCSPEIAEDLIAMAAEYEIDAQVIGHTEAHPDAKKEVVIEGPDGSFSYVK